MQLSTLLTSLFVSFAAAAAPTTRHFYTTNGGGEYAISSGYNRHITVGYSIQNGGASTVVLYRCRGGSNSDFYTFLTTSPNCEGAPGFVVEGGVTNVFVSRQPGTYELRRLVNNRGDHAIALYNPDDGSGPYGSFACDTGNYAIEGILGYMYFGAGNPNSIPLYSWRKGCNSDHDPCCT